MRKMCPDIIVKDIYEIDPAFLETRGIKGVIFDIDNTMVPFGVGVPTPLVSDYVKNLLDAGIKVSVLSNNNEARVSKFATPLGVFFCHKAGKPLKKKYKLALCDMGISAKETAVVGDQLFTDIYGGKRNGMLSILVPPIEKDTDWFILIKRKIETFVMKYGLKKGYIDRRGYDLFYGLGGEKND